VLHRDLKPANVMVGSFGEVLVLDWGVARTLTSRADVTAGPGGPGDQAGGPQTEAGTRIGTPGFMAPEQAAGDVIGPPADVYALGALLVWLLSGRVPASTDQAATILQRVNPAPSRRLTAIALKALDPNPAVRYPTAGGLLDDLARYRAGAAVTAHREHVFERAGRWLYTYRTFVLLVLAYLIMRTLFAFWSRG
jgi:serine/threonine protein kinase